MFRVARKRFGVMEASVLGELPTHVVIRSFITITPAACDIVVDANQVTLSIFDHFGISLGVENRDRCEVRLEALKESFDDFGAQECVEVDHHEVTDAVGSAVVAGIADGLRHCEIFTTVIFFDRNKEEIDFTNNDVTRSGCVVVVVVH